MANLKQTFINFDQKKNIKTFSPIIHIVFFLMGFLGISLLATLFAGLYGSALVGSIGANNAEAVHLFIVYFALTLITVLILFINRPIIDWIKSLTKDFNGFAEGVLIALICFSLTVVYSLISSEFMPHSSNNNQSGLEEAFAAQPILMFFCIVIFAPICEEFTYRFGLFGLIAKYSKTAAYLITVIVFALIHFDFAAENMINELLNLPAYLIGAVCLCYAYSRNGNILTSITAHAVYNGSQFFLMVISLIMGQ